uniref:Uncharacterized protein n=1 Tax=viral metagenome TaxID=1070528 RepID=A0A6C0AYQ6_9ZZZZ
METIRESLHRLEVPAINEHPVIEIFFRDNTRVRIFTMFLEQNDTWRVGPNMEAGYYFHYVDLTNRTGGRQYVTYNEIINYIQREARFHDGIKRVLYFNDVQNAYNQVPQEILYDITQKAQKTWKKLKVIPPVMALHKQATITANNPKRLRGMTSEEFDEYMRPATFGKSSKQSLERRNGITIAFKRNALKTVEREIKYLNRLLS